MKSLSLFSIPKSCLRFSFHSWSFLWFINLRIPEIHLFYNLQDFYWHFLEILWLFIFLFLYSFSPHWVFSFSFGVMFFYYDFAFIMRIYYVLESILCKPTIFIRNLKTWMSCIFFYFQKLL